MLSIIFSLLAFIIIGSLAGFVGGLFGIGGGVIAVPSLLLVFTMMNFPEQNKMQLAIGTSLAAMIFTAGTSAWTHFKQNGIHWNLFKLLAPAVILGAILGALIAHDLNSHQLKIVFGVIVIVVGIYTFFTANQKEEIATASPHSFLVFFLACFIATISAIMGMGGGIMIVPLLTHFGNPMRTAISTSAITGFIIALVGALSFLLLGLDQKTSTGSLGYIYLPAFFVIGITAALMARIGANYSYKLPITQLKYAFGILLIIIGLILLPGVLPLNPGKG